MPFDMERHMLLVPELGAEPSGAGGAAAYRGDRSPRAARAWKVAALLSAASALAAVAISRHSGGVRRSEKLQENIIIQVQIKNGTEKAPGTSKKGLEEATGTLKEGTRNTMLKKAGVNETADTLTDGLDNATGVAETVSGTDAPAEESGEDDEAGSDGGGCMEAWNGPCKDDEDCCEGTSCDTSDTSWAQCRPAPENITSGGCLDEWQGPCESSSDCCDDLYCDADSSWPMCSPIQCVPNGKSCNLSKCCSEPGMQCYKKNDLWSACNATCAPEYLWVESAWVQTNETQWDCEEIGERTSGGPDQSSEKSSLGDGGGNATTSAAGDSNATDD